MDYGRIVREAWSITTRTRALWWLGAIAAAQLAVYSIVVGGLAAPMALMPQVAATIGAAGTGTGASAGREQLLLSVAQWLDSHMSAIVAGVLVVFSVWIMLGVLDVAAQVGIMTQVEAVAERQVPSMGAGLRDGLRLWWRAVALLALAALPGLAYLLVMALVMFFTVSLPLYLGQPPKAGAALISNLLLSSLSGVASIVSIPLGVLVQLALRFAAVDDLEWRPAVSAAWRLAKASPAEIAVVYVVTLLLALLAFVAFTVIDAAASSVLGVLFLGGALVATSGDAAAAGRAALVGAVGFAGLLFLAFQAVMFVWQSSVWTLVWRDRTGRAARNDDDERRRVTSRRVAASTIEGSL